MAIENPVSNDLRSTFVDGNNVSIAAYKVCLAATKFVVEVVILLYARATILEKHGHCKLVAVNKDKYFNVPGCSKM